MYVNKNTHVRTHTHTFLVTKDVDAHDTTGYTGVKAHTHAPHPTTHTNIATRVLKAQTNDCTTRHSFHYTLTHTHL